MFIKNNLLLIAGVGIALVAGLLAFVMLGNANQHYAQLIAKHDISLGATIDVGRDFDQQTFSGVEPANAIDPGNVNLVQGKVTVTSIASGQPLLFSMFYAPQASLAPGASPGASAQPVDRFSELLSDPHSRAIVIDGDPTSALVRTGDHVDLVYIDSGSGESKVLMTKTVLWTQTGVAVTDKATGTAKFTGVEYILQNLNQQEAQDLLFAQQHGILRIALTSPLSVVTPSPTGALVATTAAYFKQVYGVTVTLSNTGP